MRKFILCRHKAECSTNVSLFVNSYNITGNINIKFHFHDCLHTLFQHSHTHTI